MAKFDLLTRSVKTVQEFIPTITKTAESTTKPNTILPTVVNEAQDSVKLFDDILNFVGESLGKLKEIKCDLPEGLYQQLEKAVIAKNFNLKGILGQYYSKLNDCKTIDDVKKFYPELKFPSKQAHEFLNLTKEESDRIILELMKKHFIDGERISKIKVLGNNSKEYMYRTYKNFQVEIPSIDKYSMTIIETIEKRAEKIMGLSSKGLTKSEFTSAILEKAWKKEHLKSEFAAIAKHWKSLKPIWNKKNGKNLDPRYETANLIDTYLANKYVSGARTVQNNNPFRKYYEMTQMDNSKQKFVNLLYKFAEQSDEYTYIIKSKGFRDFKSQFNIDEMSKMLDEIETHYQKTFLKIYWSEDRKARFSKAIQESISTAKQNFEFSDELMQAACNTILQ